MFYFLAFLKVKNAYINNDHGSIHTHNNKRLSRNIWTVAGGERLISRWETHCNRQFPAFHIVYSTLTITSFIASYDTSFDNYLFQSRSLPDSYLKVKV